jgi:uncharacterized membrane protein
MGNVETFLARNPSLESIECERDVVAGRALWLRVLIFWFLLLSPIVSAVPKMRGAGPAYMVIELTMVSAIAWCCVEYSHRSVVWYTCLARGVVITYEKTHEWKAWRGRTPMIFAYVFLFVHALVTYLGLDPTLSKGDLTDILTAILSILAVLFVLLMTKELVDLEGANSLLTIPMFIFFFDADVLTDRGFTVVDFQDLARYILIDRPLLDLENFSWNEIHRLTPHEPKRKPTLIDGVRVAYFLRKYRNLKS